MPIAWRPTRAKPAPGQKRANPRLPSQAFPGVTSNSWLPIRLRVSHDEPLPKPRRWPHVTARPRPRRWPRSSWRTVSTCYVGATLEPGGEQLGQVGDGEVERRRRPSLARVSENSSTNGCKPASVDGRQSSPQGRRVERLSQDPVHVATRANSSMTLASSASSSR